MLRTPTHQQLARTLPDVVGASTARQLAKLGLHTVDDLVRHVPRRYVPGGQMTRFDHLEVGDDVVVIARVQRCMVEVRSRMRVVAEIVDGAGRSISVTLFVPSSRKTRRPLEHYADFWHAQLKPGRIGIFVGKLGEFRGQLQLTHPDYVMLDGATITSRKSDDPRAKDRAAMRRVAQRSTMIGIYPATSSLRTWTIAETIGMVLPGITGDTVPDWVLEEARQPSLTRALRDVHEPVSLEQAEAGIERLRFDEAFGIQLAMAHRRATAAAEEATPRPRRDDGLLAALDASLPFTLTAGQREVGETLFDELAAPRPMHRLLQGEVGSGKTLVALRAMCAVVDAGGQAGLFSPTEGLGGEHHRAITALLGPLGAGRDLAHPTATHVTLLTGSLSAAERREALNRIVAGEAGIVVGTHALFSDPVEFFDLGLVVIDEQQRFGVEQRAALQGKAARRPHTLVMTATPIPRSIAMTIFGDLAVSELRELPAGRPDVQTVFVDTRLHPTWVDRAWERIREEAAAGHQAFVVCPMISPDDAQPDAAAVETLAPELAEGPLTGLRIGTLHGKQDPVERDRTMAAFVAGEIDVLVATTVIEVGVDVPNATVMCVLDADHYGVSQLHQLRGRIGRGTHPGLCLLLAAVEPETPAAERLEAVAASRDGVAVAEGDLRLRKEGDVLGTGQSGASSLKILRIADVDLIERTRALAERVVQDPRADEDPLLADLLEQAAELAVGEWMEKG